MTERRARRQEDRRRRQPAGVVARVGQYSALVLLTVILLGPVLWIVASAFKTNAQILSGTWFIPNPATVAGFIDAFTIGNLDRFFFNSFFVSITSTVLVLLFGSLAAYPLARFAFPLSHTLTVVFSLGIMIPVTSMIVPVSLLVRELGLYDSTYGLIVVYTALNFPLAFIILRVSFAGIPKELEEAAMVDGASYFTLFWRIAIPVSVPALSTVAVIAFVTSWNEFLYALLLTASTENRTVQVAIRFFTSQFAFNLPGLFATVTIVMLVPIVIFVMLQERVTSGLTAGATKQ